MEGGSYRPSFERSRRRRRWAARTALVTLTGVVLAGPTCGLVNNLRPRAGPTPPARDHVITGQLPTGQPWKTVVHVGARVCIRFSLAGMTEPERCEPVSNRSHFVAISTRDAGALRVTWGIVSKQTERVRVTPVGHAPAEVAAVGADRGLPVRLFVVSHVMDVPVTFTALAASGIELEHQSEPAHAQLPAPLVHRQGQGVGDR